MKPTVSKNANPSLAEPVTELVAEGGNALTSDDAPTAVVGAPVRAPIPSKPAGPAAQARPILLSLPAGRRILH